jgi:hypothetical protein
MLVCHNLLGAGLLSLFVIRKIMESYLFLTDLSDIFPKTERVNRNMQRHEMGEKIRLVIMAYLVNLPLIKTGLPSVHYAWLFYLVL